MNDDTGSKALEILNLQGRLLAQEEGGPMEVSQDELALMIEGLEEELKVHPVGSEDFVRIAALAGRLRRIKIN